VSAIVRNVPALLRRVYDWQMAIKWGSVTVGRFAVAGDCY
jgi:hypothetical protein